MQPTKQSKKTSKKSVQPEAPLPNMPLDASPAWQVFFRAISEQAKLDQAERELHPLSIPIHVEQ